MNHRQMTQVQNTNMQVKRNVIHFKLSKLLGNRNLNVVLIHESMPTTWTSGMALNVSVGFQ